MRKRRRTNRSGSDNDATDPARATLFVPTEASKSEADMPTTIAAVSPDTNTPGLPHSLLAIVTNRDLIAVTAFSAVGLLMTIGLALLAPVSEGWVALLASTP
jgi:hypothetical protein